MVVEQILEKVRERGRVVKDDVCEYITVIRDETDEQKELLLTQFLNGCPDVDVARGRGKRGTAREKVMAGWKEWEEEMFPPNKEKAEEVEKEEDSADEVAGTAGEEKFTGPDTGDEDAPDDA